MYKITEYLINGLSSMIAVEYISHGFEKKHRGSFGILLAMAGCLLYFLTVTALNWMSQYEGVLGLCYGVVLYLYGRLALSGKRTEMAVLCLIWVLIAAVSASVIFGILGIMTDKGIETLLMSEGEERIYSAFAAGVLKFSLGRMALALYRKKRGASARMEDGLMGVICLLIFLLVIGMFYMQAEMLSRKESYYLSLCLSGGMVMLGLLACSLCRRLEMYRREKLETEYEKAKQDIQKKQIHELYRIGREANHMRHDMKVKLHVVYRLLKAGKYEEAEECIGKLGDEWGDYQELPQDTGNEGLNAALLKAIQECRERGVRFHYVILGKIEKIDSMDMGNLVYNLLINGIEASEMGEGVREVEIIVKREHEGIAIEVGNNIRESVISSNPYLKSHKKESMRHGFGMGSIREIVEKYHGEYSYWEEDNWFMQKIFLYS